MSEDWLAVGEAINRRVTRLRITQQEVARRSGLSPATIREITRAYEPRQRRGRTLGALSEALEWPPDHLEDVLHGRISPTDDPTPTGEAPAPDVIATALHEIRDSLSDLRGRLEAIEQTLQRDHPHRPTGDGHIAAPRGTDEDQLHP